MSKVGIGIIGCGTIADVYMTNITQHYNNVELLAVADLYIEKAQQAAEKFNVPRACSVDELLAMDEIKIVLNLTIPAAHYSVNLQILNAGKHLYCEKPLTLDFNDAKEVVETAKAKGLMAVSAPDTFLGAGAQTCRTLVDEGKIGKVIGFTANMTCPGHELWHPAPGFRWSGRKKTPRSPRPTASGSRWRTPSKTGAGKSFSVSAAALPTTAAAVRRRRWA